MINRPTGPELFRRASAMPPGQPASNAAVQAQTAAILALVDAVAPGLYEMDAWREVIPRPPLKECKGKDNRRPACAERHTEDCVYADPVPEPESEHVLLAVGTRVLVSDWERDNDGVLRLLNPETGRISGYDMSRSKYRWQREWDLGHYSKHESWAFADNRVMVHPDGPECPLVPEPVKQEPTGPRIYVRNLRGKQGHILAMQRQDDRLLVAKVQWFTPGAQPVWVDMGTLTIMAPEDVDRCPHGQTRDECDSGENQCEPCLQAKDEEGDEIEKSMGLR